MVGLSSGSMKCDCAITFGNQGIDTNATNEVVLEVERRLRNSGFDIDAVLAVEGSPQAPGLSGTVDADDPKAAAHQITELVRRTLRQFQRSGWNVICAAWPNREPLTAGE